MHVFLILLVNSACQTLISVNYSNPLEENTTSTAAAIATLRPKGHTKSASISGAGRNASDNSEINRPRLFTC